MTTEPAFRGMRSASPKAWHEPRVSRLVGWHDLEQLTCEACEVPWKSVNNCSVKLKLIHSVLRVCWKTMFGREKRPVNCKRLKRRSRSELMQMGPVWDPAHMPSFCQAIACKMRESKRRGEEPRRSKCGVRKGDPGAVDVFSDVFLVNASWLLACEFPLGVSGGAEVSSPNLNVSGSESHNGSPPECETRYLPSCQPPATGYRLLQAIGSRVRNFAEIRVPDCEFSHRTLTRTSLNQVQT